MGRPPFADVFIDRLPRPRTTGDPWVAPTTTRHADEEAQSRLGRTVQERADGIAARDRRLAAVRPKTRAVRHPGVDRARADAREAADHSETRRRRDLHGA